MNRGGLGSFHDVFHADMQVADGHPWVVSSSPLLTLGSTARSWAAAGAQCQYIEQRPNHTGRPPTCRATSEHSLRCRHHGEPGLCPASYASDLRCLNTTRGSIQH